MIIKKNWQTHIVVSKRIFSLFSFMTLEVPCFIVEEGGGREVSHTFFNLL